MRTLERIRGREGHAIGVDPGKNAGGAVRVDDEGRIVAAAWWKKVRRDKKDAWALEWSSLPDSGSVLGGMSHDPWWAPSYAVRCVLVGAPPDTVSAVEGVWVSGRKTGLLELAQSAGCSLGAFAMLSGGPTPMRPTRVQWVPKVAGVPGTCGDSPILAAMTGAKVAGRETVARWPSADSPLLDGFRDNPHVADALGIAYFAGGWRLTGSG